MGTRNDTRPGAETPASGRARSAGLDLARALAILPVCAAHFGAGFAAGSPNVFAALIYGGNAGVELFFSLSGFLIGRILIRLARDGVGMDAIGGFWARRWLRTLPVYYAVLAACCWYLGDWDWRSFLFLQNFGFQSRSQPLMVSWSLVMEEYFYFSFPLLMLALVRLRPRLHGLRVVAVIAVALAAGCALARVGLSVAGVGGDDPSFHLNPVLRLDCAAYGVLAASLWETGRGRWRALLVRPAIRWSLVAGVAAFLLLDGTLYVRVLLDPGFVRHIRYDAWKAVYVPSRDALMNLAFAVFVLAVAELRLGRIVAVPAGWLSRLSYSIYLVHVPVLYFLVPALLPGAGLQLRVPVAVVATLLVSFATWSLIETPFLAWRDRHVPTRLGRPMLAAG